VSDERYNWGFAMCCLKRDIPCSTSSQSTAIPCGCTHCLVSRTISALCKEINIKRAKIEELRDENTRLRFVQENSTFGCKECAGG